ncbi:MAG: hypothetical protein EON54_16230 [Alcaligenaceae bacterium]|nr:MAG: hypothetical protein EON54_16230 [Alcaligenaceae bacterium]
MRSPLQRKRAFTSTSLLKKKVRDNGPQPTVSRVLLVPVMPVLLDRKGGQIEGRCQQSYIGDPDQRLGYTPRYGH